MPDFPDYDEANCPAKQKSLDHGVARDVRDYLLENDHPSAEGDWHHLASVEEEIDDASVNRIRRVATSPVGEEFPGWDGPGSREGWSRIDPSQWFDFEEEGGPNDYRRIRLTPVGEHSLQRDRWRGDGEPDAEDDGATEVAAGD